MKIHVVIVSGEQLQNLIPLLMEQPDKVYLLASKKMIEMGNAKHLTDIIKHANQLNKTHIVAEICEDMPDFNMNDIQNFVLESASKIQGNHPHAEFTINATGGNKLMSMGLVDVWRGEANKIIYSDTQHGRIEILPDAKGHVSPAIAMENRLDVPLYLRTQKFNYAGAASDNLQWVELANERKEICKRLAKEVSTLTWLISDINRAARLAMEHSYVNGKNIDILARPEQELSAYPRGENLSVLKMMAAADLLIWQEGSKNIKFHDLEKLRFLSGGWLEEYAWHVLRDEKLFDVRLSVNVTDKQTGNEFDVLACQQNQLLFIECKTLRFTNENDNEIAYKVDSLGQDARGLFGETWLLSARTPTAILKDRATKARIKLIGPDELPKLRDIVREWKSAKTH